MNAKPLPTTLTPVTGKIRSLPASRMPEKRSAAIVEAIEKERLRFGQELHDNVNQLLGSALLYISLVKPATAIEKDHKARGMALVRQSIKEIQQLSRGIVAPRIKNEEWLAGIRSMLGDLEKTRRIKVAFDYSQNGSAIPQRVKLAVYRIIQEQVKNIVAHSKASRLSLSINSDPHHIKLLMTDNGVGMHSTGSVAGIGLSNIQHRVKALNGVLHIKTAPGKGCSLEVIFSRKRQGTLEI